MSHRQNKNNEGVALLLVLVFVLLLSVIVVDYCYETQVEASQVSNMNADFEAYVAAKSAVATGMAVLQADWQPQVNNQNNIQNNNGNNGNNNNQPQALDARTEQWAQLASFQKMNNAECRCIIEDEGGKLNLNALIKDNQPNEMLVAALRNLFEAMEVEEDPTDAILDWLDEDDDVRDLGAESDDYESSEVPYSCKNGPMNSIEELLLIRGITPEIYFGLNKDAQKIEEEDEKKNEREYDEAGTRSLADLLTVHGHPDGKINVNTARRELLEAVYVAQGGAPDQAEAVMQRQLSQPLEAGEVQEPFVVESDFFRLQGDGRSGDTMVRVETYVLRTKRGSELPPQGQMFTPKKSDEPLAPSFVVWDWKVYR